MKRKISFGIISLCLSAISLFCCLASCTAAPSSKDAEGTGEKEKYTVTFRQDGEDDVVRTVEAGGTLEDIPEPAPRPGYTVTWEEKDFTNITAGFIVNAEQTPNVYTITYDLGVNRYATLDSYTAQVTYNEQFVLKTPQYTGSAATFLGWYLADSSGKATGEKAEDGIYIWTEDITLIAKWNEWSPVVS